jgi:chitin disaccharide deacetylase
VAREGFLAACVGIWGVSIERFNRSSPADVADDASGRRHIWLCADDYGISTAVNVAIRDLVVRGHLNATSVMVVAPSFHRSEALSLNVLNAGMPRVAIGLHVTLTAPFRPLSKGYKPTRDGTFLPLGATLARALMHGLNRDAITNEIAAQLRLFVHTFGRPPDFIDGHQHVQLFPQVRDALLKVSSQNAPDAWVRQCGRVGPLSQRMRDRKALLLDLLSQGFRQRATALGVRTNPGFAGAYEFSDRANFAALFTRFLDRLPSGSVVMCHPGFVDAELQRLDPLTTLREREYAFLADEGFPNVLAANGVVLA